MNAPSYSSDYGRPPSGTSPNAPTGRVRDSSRVIVRTRRGARRGGDHETDLVHTRENADYWSDTIKAFDTVKSLEMHLEILFFVSPMMTREFMSISFLNLMQEWASEEERAGRGPWYRREGLRRAR